MSDTTPTGPSVVYQQVNINVTNAQPGEKIVVTLVPQGGFVAWSTGDPMLINSSGILLTSTAGQPVPVEKFSVTTHDLIITTSSSGGGAGALSLSVHAFLAASSGTQFVGVSSSTDPGPLVTFAFAGQTELPLGQGVSFFKWP
jgi:hypothetical protein